MFDVHGTTIQPGDVVRVLVFNAASRERHCVYETAVLQDGHIKFEAVRLGAFGSVSFQDLHHCIVGAAKRLLDEQKIEISHGRLRAGSAA